MIYFLDTNLCLDLLDSKRSGSRETIEWYFMLKDHPEHQFRFAGDALTTIYYILSERRGFPRRKVVEALDAMSREIEPVFANQHDFIEARENFYEGVCDDFEDLMMLAAAQRAGSDLLLTRDRGLLQLERYGTVKIESIES